MISEVYSEDIYIADFTELANKEGKENLPYSGVVVSTQDNGIIPSFVLTDENSFPFVVVNNEKNPALFTRTVGSKVSQCECIMYAERHDKRKGWMIFLELKYCEAKNIYQNMLDGIPQLKATCKYVMDEKGVFDATLFKKYLVISTPGVSPLDPFDASYFDQDYMLTVKEETGAVLKACNIAHIQTPALLTFEEYN